MLFIWCVFFSNKECNKIEFKIPECFRDFVKAQIKSGTTDFKRAGLIFGEIKY